MEHVEAADLRREILRLAPWHYDIEVVPGLSTSAFLESHDPYPEWMGPIGFSNPRDSFLSLLNTIYPSGLQGRSVLDCACNCGGYLFWAREAGAGSCFGFDVREHWIRQARFLAAHRGDAARDMTFEVRDLYDVPARGLPLFDVVLFQGIFYHLPDPVAGLRIAADLARELLVLNTASCNMHPDGVLVAYEESTERLVSGVHGLAWMPTGPKVVASILRWLGFAEIRCLYWLTDTAPAQPDNMGRIVMVASRSPELLQELGPGSGLAP